MRCNQVSIGIERFGEYVPKNYPGNVQRISVYVDDFTSIYAALSKAYALAINELAEYDHIGARTNVRTNEYAGVNYKKMHGTIPKERRAYEEDVNFEYEDTHYELCKDYIWLYEHSTEIIDAIKNSRNPGEMTIELKEKYGLSDYQIKKLSQIRLDMLTTEKYEECKCEMARIEDARKQRADGSMGNKIGYKVRFDFSLNQTRYLRYMPLYIFDKKVREEKKQELARVMELIEFYEKECNESEE